MKRVLLTGLFPLMALTVQAQQRLALYEEFSGENCGPCAAKNPALWSLLSAPGNDSKVLLLKYQSPIPSAGPIYEQNPHFTDARLDYYMNFSAPFGILNGTPVGSGQSLGDVAVTTQAMINAASGTQAPFTINISNPVYSADGQSFTATITVTATASVAAVNALMRLRFALVEELDYTSPPGTNGEDTFHNVVRQMYPGPNGQSMPTTWSPGQSATYTVTGGIPSYVNPASPHRFFAAWLQTDLDRNVLQAAKTGNITIQKPTADVALTGVTGVSGLICQVPASIAPVATIKNTGTQPLTSATIFYQAGTAAWSSQQWTGNLAPGAAATVNMPAFSLTSSGTQYVRDSVALPNGKTDYNTYDNTFTGTPYILNNTAVSLPLSYDFEAADPDWVYWPGTSANPAFIERLDNQVLGHNGSGAFAYFNSYDLGQGANGYLVFPKMNMPAGSKTLEFYLAYAEWAIGSLTRGDKLEVDYSTDCGLSWTPVWSAANEDLATAPGISTAYRPSPADWKLKTIDISQVPNGAYLAFKATSGNGNDMFIDDIHVRTGSGTNIETLIRGGNALVYPNPLQQTLNIDLDMVGPGEVTFSVYNVLGQLMVPAVLRHLPEGRSTTSIDAGRLAAGMYYVDIATAKGSLQQKFIKQ